MDPWRPATITTTANSHVVSVHDAYHSHTARINVRLVSHFQSRLDDALSVMAGHTGDFDDAPTIGVGGAIHVPLEEDIADTIPAHSLLTDEEPVDLKPTCK